MEQVINEYIVEITITLLAIVAIISLHVFKKLREGVDTETEEDTPELKPFSNIVTLGMALLCIMLFVPGIAFMAYTGSPIGAAMAVAGVLIWWKGDTQFDTGGREAGILTLWGSFFKINGKIVVVGGRTILADYWPIYLGAVRIDMRNHDKDFPMTLIAKDNMPLEGVISVTKRPKMGDLIDYLQAGGSMEKIDSQLDEIIFEVAQAEARKHGGADIAKNNKLVTGDLERQMKSGVFDSKLFGIDVQKVKGRLKPTKTVFEAMEDAAKEVYERSGELEETETDVLGAEKLTQRLGIPKEGSLDAYTRLRMIRDGVLFKVESSGGNLTVNEVKINQPQGKKKGKE